MTIKSEIKEGMEDRIAHVLCQSSGEKGAGEGCVRVPAALREKVNGDWNWKCNARNRIEVKRRGRVVDCRLVRVSFW